MERARELARTRRPGRLAARHGGNEGAITPVSVHDHQLGSSGLHSAAMAMVSLAQRWCGSSTLVNMLSTDEFHLLELLDAAPPQAAHMSHELRSLATRPKFGWVVRPPAAGDEAIYGAYMREAGATGRTEAAIARL